MLHHPFLSAIYYVKDLKLKEGKPVQFYDFEFEQYRIKRSFLRELLIDEIVLANSLEARNYNDNMKRQNPNGVLEQIFETFDYKNTVKN